MNINYLMGLCLVAVSVGVAVKFIAWLAATYPLVLIVAVIIFVAGGLYRIYKRIAYIRGKRSG